VPGLDLLAEDDLELVLVFLGDQRPDGVVEGVELLGRELWEVRIDRPAWLSTNRANIVEV
jgi:hypothetical protein